MRNENVRQCAFSLFFLLISSALYSQAPQAINYQAVARDAQGQPIPDKQIAIQISILDGSINGNTVYAETHQKTTSQFGLFTLAIGQGSVQSGSFAAIDWAGGNKFLKVNIDNTLQGTTQLLSVPYALYAAKAKEGQTLSVNGNQLSISEGNMVTLPGASGGGALNDLDDVNTSGVSNGQVLQWNGSLWVPATVTSGGTYSAGVGISINGTTIQNTGDTNPSDDITTTSQAGGDMTGPFANLQIAPNSVGTAEIVDGAVTGDKIAQQSATNGQVLKWNGATWAPANDVGGGNGDNWGSQVVQTSGGTFSGNGTTGNPLALAQQGAINGQVLKWNGSTWSPATDETGGSGNNYTAGMGINITGNSPNFTVINTGDTNPSDDITTTSQAGGDVSGTFSNLQIGPNTIGTNEITNGSIQAADLAAGVIPATLPPSGPAGGDLSGAYPNPTVAKIQGKPVTATAPVDGQVLRYNGTTQQWEPVTQSGGGSGWNLTGNSGTNPATNFIGTTDGQPIAFRVNGIERMKLWGDGRLDIIGSGTDNSNTFVGSDAGKNNTIGNYNCFFGKGVGQSNTFGYYNTASGWLALFSNTEGSNNTAVGNFALKFNTTGSGNTAYGNTSLLNNTTGGNNTSIGVNSLHDNLTGNYNTAMGLNTLADNTTGNNNIAIGNNALRKNTSVNDLIAIGDSALYQNIDGQTNIAIGSKSLYSNSSGSGNTAIGYSALRNNTIGSINTAIGGAALSQNTTANDNTAIGALALYATTTGWFNTANGASALHNNATGASNTAIGADALFWNVTGNENTGIGRSAGPASAFTNLSNSIAIGYSSQTTASNSARIGNTSITSIGGQVNWTALSDARFKNDIKEEVKGLDFIRRLRPVTYQYDIAKLDDFLGTTARRSERGDTLSHSEIESREKASSIRYTGFIAQEVEQAARELGFDFSGVDAPDNEHDLYGLRYAEFTVPLVKAVQEQQAIIEAQQAQLKSLQEQLLSLAAEVKALKGEKR